MEQTSEKIVVNVKSTSDPGRQAGFISLCINERGVKDITLRAVGASASYQAIKVVLTLNYFLASKGKEANILPVKQDTKDTEGERLVLMEFKLKISNL